MNEEISRFRENSEKLEYSLHHPKSGDGGKRQEDYGVFMVKWWRECYEGSRERVAELNIDL